MILAPEDKPVTPEDFDKLVCAEFPNKDQNPLLFQIISKHTIHGSCGNLNPTSSCMENGKCKKYYF
jgi:hypothetical protein